MRVFVCLPAADLVLHQFMVKADPQLWAETETSNDFS